MAEIKILEIATRSLEEHLADGPAMSAHAEEALTEGRAQLLQMKQQRLGEEWIALLNLKRIRVTDIMRLWFPSSSEGKEIGIVEVRLRMEEGGRGQASGRKGARGREARRRCHS